MSTTAEAVKPIVTDAAGRPESSKANGAGKTETSSRSSEASGATKHVITAADVENARLEVARTHSELLAVTRSMPKEGKRVPKGVMYDVMEGVARAAQSYREAYTLYQSITS